MVLESPGHLAQFLLERYRRKRSSYGDVLARPRDVYDMNFPAFVEEHAEKIHRLAVKLKSAYPHVPEEKHALLAYLLHVYSLGVSPLYAPHNRVLPAPRRFFIDYAREALGTEEFERLRQSNKHTGISVKHVLGRVPDHGVPERVLAKRFLLH